MQFVEILRESEISFIHNDCVLGQSKCFLSRFGYYGKLKRASLHRVSVLFWRPRPETSCYSGITIYRFGILTNSIFKVLFALYLFEFIMANWSIVAEVQEDVENIVLFVR